MTRAELYSSMFFGTALELRLFLGAVLLGMLLGAVYDILRAVRLTFRHPGWAVFLEDFIFMLICGVMFYTFCTELCRGKMRFFVAAGAVGGFAAYLLTLGRAIVSFNALIVKSAKKFLTFIGKVLKKFLGDLCGVPFFAKSAPKIEENPCADDEN